MDSISSHYFYVYTLSSSLTSKVFYVGKGMGNGRKYYYRMRFHENQARSGYHSHKCHTIRQIWNEGGKVIKKEIAKFAEEQDAFIYEWCLINLIYGRKNLSNETDGGEGSYGFKHSPDYYEKCKDRWEAQRETMSQTSKQWWSDPEFREKQLEFLRSPEFRAAQLRGARKTKNAKTYDGFVAPDGTVYAPVTNMTAFSKEHGLFVTSMLKVDNGEVLSHKGWTRINPRKPKPPVWKPLSRQVNLRSPDGIPHEAIPNVAAFCREHGLDRTAIFKLLKGRVHSHKGWTLL